MPRTRIWLVALAFTLLSSVCNAQQCSCGNGHTLSGAGSCISGGVSNTVTSSNGVVGGGQDNEVARDYATIGGGRDNVVVGAYAAICGGQSNSARGDYASVGGGSKNIATLSATVAGGKNNAANAQFGSIGGGYLNSLSGYAAHIGGGVGNSAYAKYSFVAGGSANLASAEFASVGGGSNNRVAGTYSAIGGGKFNTVSSTGAFAVLAGGHANKAVSAFAVVSGGAGNTATAEYAVVGGGFENRATGTGAAVVGGSANDAAGNHSLALGSAASAAHNNSAVLGFGLTKCYSIARHSVSVCAPNGFFINGYLLNASAFDDVTFLRQKTLDHAAQLGRLGGNVSSVRGFIAELQSVDLDIAQQLADMQSATQYLQDDVLGQLSDIYSQLGLLGMSDEELQAHINALGDRFFLRIQQANASLSALSELQSAVLMQHLSDLRGNVTQLHDHWVDALQFSDALFVELDVIRANVSTLKVDQDARISTTRELVDLLTVENTMLQTNLTSVESQCMQRATAINDSLFNAIAMQRASALTGLTILEANVSRLGGFFEASTAHLNARLTQATENISSLADADFVVRNEVSFLQNNVTWLRDAVTSLLSTNRSTAEEARRVRHGMSALSTSVRKIEANVSALHSAVEQCNFARKELEANNSAQAHQIQILSEVVSNLSNTVARMEAVFASLTTAAHFVATSNDVPSQSSAHVSLPSSRAPDVHSAQLDTSFRDCDNCRTLAKTSLATTAPAGSVSPTTIIPVSSISMTTPAVSSLYPTTQELTFSIPADAIASHDGESTVDLLRAVCDSYLHSACTDVHAANSTGAETCSDEAMAELPSRARLVLTQKATTTATVNFPAHTALRSCNVSGAEAAANYSALFAEAIGSDPICPTQILPMCGSTCGAVDARVSFADVGVYVTAGAAENVQCVTPDNSHINVSVSFQGGWASNDTRRSVTGTLGLSAANLLLANDSLVESTTMHFQDELRISIAMFVPASGVVDWDKIAITDIVSALRALEHSPTPAPSARVSDATTKSASLTSVTPSHSNLPDGTIVAVGSSVGVVAFIVAAAAMVAVLIRRRRQLGVGHKTVTAVQPRTSWRNVQRPQRSQSQGKPPASFTHARRPTRRKVMPGVTLLKAAKKSTLSTTVSKDSGSRQKVRAKRGRASRRRRDRSWTKEAQDLQGSMKTDEEEFHLKRDGTAAVASRRPSPLVVSARLQQKILARRKRMSPARSTSAGNAVITDGVLPPRTNTKKEALTRTGDESFKTDVHRSERQETGL